MAKYFEFRDGKVIEKDPGSLPLESPNLFPEYKNAVFTTFSTHNVGIKNAHQFVTESYQNAAHTGETVYNPALFCLDYHLERILSNARALKILSTKKEHSESFLKDSVIQLLVDHTPQFVTYYDRMRIRLLITDAGSQLHISSFVPRWPLGTSIRAATVPIERENVEIKSVDISTAHTARDTIKNKNADEAFLVDRNGFIREGSWSNIFWFEHDRSLNTVEANVLKGVTRRAVLENFPCILKDITENDLTSVAKEVFITQSTTSITPVVAINDAPIGNGKAGEQTQNLQAAFLKLIEDKAIKIHNV